jgi:O-antigen/teichoic acid export membrane protein
MRLKFFSHLFVMIALNLLIKPIAIFGVDAQVQNTIGSENYGQFFALLNFSYLFNILLDLGITNFNIKNLSSRPHLANSYLSKILPVRLVLFFVYVVITLIIALFLGYTLYQFKLLIILVLNQFLISVILYLRSYFSGLLFLKIEVLLSVFDKLLLIGLMYFLFFLNNNNTLTIEKYLWVQSLTYLITLLLASILLIRKVGKPKIKWHFQFNRLILKKSFPYALLIVLMMIYNRIDAVMLERISGQHQAGIYAQAYRILDALFMFASLFSSLLFPLFSNGLSKKTTILPLLKSSKHFLISSAIIICSILIINAEFLLNLVYSQHVLESTPVFQLLMLSFIPICFIVINGTLITAMGNLKYLSIISFIGIILNIILNSYFIPLQGAYGAAISTLITQSLIAVLQLIYLIIVLNLKHQFFQLPQYAGLILLIFTLNYFLQKTDASLLSIFIYGVILCFYCFISNLYEWRLFIPILNKKN